MKAKQIRAQYDAQNGITVKKHKSRRIALTGLAAAAVLLVGGAVTVGAVNDWNYGAVFNRYFTEKSGEPVSFDYTGMGLNIGKEITGDGFTLTVQSVMADSSNVYIAYDIALSREISETVCPDDSTTVSLLLDPAIMDGDTMLNRGGSEFPAVRGDDGIWHGITVIEKDAGTDLNGKQLVLRHIAEQENNKEDADKLIFIGYDYNNPDGTCKKMQLSAPDFDLHFDLSGITVQQGKTLPYGGTLPNDANSNIFDTVTVTPFMLRFESSGTIGVMDSAPKWGMVFDNDAIAVSYTAVYADGTELALRRIRNGMNHSMTVRRPDGRYDWDLVRTYCFDTPFSLDGLTAIRINDTVIPIA